MKAKLIKCPSSEDWIFCKQCALVTVGKQAITEPTQDWKHKMLEARHSPIRVLQFAFELDIPYWVSVHLVRHIHAQPFVKSQRNDRQNNYDRTKAPQDAMVSHIMSVNAQELVFMSHKRLCRQADPFTRAVMKEIVRQVVEICPEFKEVLVPLCEYRNKYCSEFYPCGRIGKKNEN